MRECTLVKKKNIGQVKEKKIKVECCKDVGFPSVCCGKGKADVGVGEALIAFGST